VTALQLEPLRAYLTAQIGFDVEIDSPRIRDVIERRARACSVTPAEYVAGTYRADLDSLIAEITVGETYFFRHAEQLAALFDHVLPDRVAAGNRPVRILSAGCATGEEPYSIAIGIREAGLDPSAFEIHAFDVNEAAIARARAACYARWALRETTPGRVAAWFTKHGRDFALAPQIRDAVTFERRNILAADTWPAAFYDVVLCRNVLMYFAGPAMAATVARMAASLRPGGFLLLGYAETLSRTTHGLEVCHTHGAFYYRRPAAAAPAAQGDWVAEIARSSERIERLGAREKPVPAPAAVVRDNVVERAMSSVEQGRFGEAEELCHRAEHDDAAAAEHILSLCSEAAGELLEALVHAHHAVTLDPALAMAWVHLGLLAQRTGDAALVRIAMPRAIDALTREDASRLALFGGGFHRDALIALCQAQLAALGAS
jgi:chemotaxis protein methyltransferase CheR